MNMVPYHFILQKYLHVLTLSVSICDYRFSLRMRAIPKYTLTQIFGRKYSLTKNSLFLSTNRNTWQGHSEDTKLVEWVLEGSFQATSTVYIFVFILISIVSWVTWALHDARHFQNKWQRNVLARDGRSVISSRRYPGPENGTTPYIHTTQHTHTY